MIPAIVAPRAMVIKLFFLLNPRTHATVVLVHTPVPGSGSAMRKNSAKYFLIP